MHEKVITKIDEAKRLTDTIALYDGKLSVTYREALNEMIENLNKDCAHFSGSDLAMKESAINGVYEAFLEKIERLMQKYSFYKLLNDVSIYFSETHDINLNNFKNEVALFRENSDKLNSISPAIKREKLDELMASKRHIIFALAYFEKENKLGKSFLESLDQNEKQLLKVELRLELNKINANLGDLGENVESYLEYLVDYNKSSTYIPKQSKKVGKPKIEKTKTSIKDRIVSNVSSIMRTTNPIYIKNIIGYYSLKEAIYDYGLGPKLKKIDWSLALFDGVDIRYVDFSNKKVNIDPQKVLFKSLYQVNLKGNDLSLADFTDVDIEEANLEGTGAKIDPERVQDKTLKGANLKDLDLRYADFTDADIRDVNLEGTDAKIDPQRVFNKTLKGANLKDLDLRYADFTDVDIREANLEETYARIDPQKVRDKSLRGANVSRVIISEADFTGVDIEGANLEGNYVRLDPQKVKNKSLEETNLKGLDLREADFVGVYISGANLSWTGARINPQLVKNKDLENTNLVGLDLSEADFTGVAIEGANLEGTGAKIDPQKVRHKSLKGANLKGLDLSKADFTGVNIDGANLEGTGARIGINQHQTIDPKPEQDTMTTGWYR